MGIGNFKKFMNKLKLQEIRVLVYEGNVRTTHKFNSATEIFSTINSRSEFDLIDSRCNYNKEAFYITQNGALAHVSWLFKNKLLARQLGFKRHYIIGDCFTTESFKGKGFYGITISHIIHSFPFKDFVLFIEPHNFSSIRGIEKIGLSLVGDYSVFRFLGIAYNLKKHVKNS